jgi:hypothetical protein
LRGHFALVKESGQRETELGQEGFARHFVRAGEDAYLGRRVVSDNSM